MTRELPLECPHGAVIDWADFGCECGEDGACLAPAVHRAPEPCGECDSPYVEVADANPERVNNGCQIYKAN
jgi:hypothetical protein